MASCLSLSNVVRESRQFDLFGSLLGLLLSSLHLVVLLFIKYGRAGRGFELLLAQVGHILSFLLDIWMVMALQSALSLVTLVSLVFGCLIDLCFVSVSPFFAFFRAHIWLFIVNRS
jgi:hypothetical protein